MDPCAVYAATYFGPSGLATAQIAAPLPVDRAAAWPNCEDSAAFSHSLGQLQSLMPPAEFSGNRPLGFPPSRLPFALERLKVPLHAWPLVGAYPNLPQHETGLPPPIPLGSLARGGGIRGPRDHESRSL